LTDRGAPLVGISRLEIVPEDERGIPRFIGPHVDNETLVVRDTGVGNGQDVLPPPASPQKVTVPPMVPSAEVVSEVRMRIRLAMTRE
jgi:hypothetical protein